MAITNGYCTLNDLKRVVFNASPGNIDWDAELEDAINSASRTIDQFCGRRFYSTTHDETFYFSSKFSDVLYLSLDILSVTTLSTDSDGDRDYDDVWAATDFDLMPTEAAYASEPYTWIKTAPNGTYSFPTGIEKAIKIVGKFGYCATASIPAKIKWCCRQEALRQFMLKNAPFGIAGSIEEAQLASPPGMDKTVAEMLQPYIRGVYNG